MRLSRKVVDRMLWSWPRPTAALAAALSLAGCSVTTRYLAPPEQVAQAAQVPPPEAHTTALPVFRLRGPGKPLKPVLVRAEALSLAQPEPMTAPPIWRSRRYSPVVTAGAALTMIGSAISVVGSIIYFATSDTTQLQAGIVALSAEPMMLTGTILWIVGLVRPPQEVSAGRPDVRYLPPWPPPAPALGPAAGPAPVPALTLRF